MKRAQFVIPLVSVFLLFAFAVSAPPGSGGSGACTLTGSSIIASCSSGATTQCDEGEYITMKGTFSGDCTAGDFYQIDAAGGGCDLLYAGGDMSGISDPGVVVNQRKKTLTGSWRIPAIHPACSDKSVTASLGKLYDGGPPGTGTLLSQKAATGSFRFAYIPPSCTDNWRNQDETDVDCGGTVCPGCAPGQACLVPDDCTSRNCVGGVCQAPTCTDDIQNQDETDVDCGGSTCPSCGNGQTCNGNSDCVSNYCANGICTQPTCTDGVKNQDETDVDCGGRVCRQCDDGQNCQADGDCATGRCEGGVCAIPGTCYELYPGHNDASADRVNIVFLGVDYPTRQSVVDAAKRNTDLLREFNEGKAFTELEVYKEPENLAKFNLWYIPGMGRHGGGDVSGCTEGSCWCSDNCKYATLEQSYCTGLTDRYMAKLCNWACRSSANSLSKYVFISSAQLVPDTYDHEEQHAFAGLADEYTEGSRDAPKYPNCADSQAQAGLWWGDLVGQEKEGLMVGFYNGCSYVNNNIRPTTTSLMRAWREYRLGLVNERHIAGILGNFTGNRTNTSNDSGGAPPDTRNAIEITLDQQFNIIGSKPIVGGYRKELYPERYRLELSIGGQTFGMGFDTVEHEIAEGVGQMGEMTGEMRVTSPNSITVVVPLGAARATADGSRIVLPGSAAAAYRAAVHDRRNNARHQIR